MNLTQNSSVSLGLVLTIIGLGAGAVSGGVSFIVSAATTDSTITARIDDFEREFSEMRTDRKQFTEDMKRTREDIGKIFGILEQMNRDQ